MQCASEELATYMESIKSAVLPLCTYHVHGDISIYLMILSVWSDEQSMTISQKMWLKR